MRARASTPRRIVGVVVGAIVVVATCLAALACDTEKTCAVSCPTGSRFTNDGTCACEPFDAGYCATAKDCPDAFCPASDAPDACGEGQQWSTTVCGCYPVPTETQ